MKANAMSAEKLEAMKARMVEAEWDGTDWLAEACADCENGADVADVLIHHLDIPTGDIESSIEAWELVKTWADGGFTSPAPF